MSRIRTGDRRFEVRRPGERTGAVLIILLVLGGIVIALNQSRPPSLDYILGNLPTLAHAAQLTVFVTIASYGIGMALGFFMGWMKSLRRAVPRGIATAWVETFRGTPVFVQLLFFFYLFLIYFPTWPERLLLTGFVTLTLNTSAYQAEIYRAGLQSVAAGQVEAAKAVGLGYWRSMRYVILPQAVRIVVPPLTNEYISLTKASALLFFIGLRELTYRGRVLSFGGNLLEVYMMVVALYLLMLVPLSKVVGWLERKYRIPGMGVREEPLARRDYG